MNNNTYRFLGFELEPAQRRLAQDGRAIALTPKVFDTLVLLVERAGQVVTKEELMRALWPRGYVEESNLTKHIWLIRRALGQGDQDAGIIDTLPKVGYRFAAAVTVAASESAIAPPAPLRTVAPAPDPQVLGGPASAAGTSRGRVGGSRLRLAVVAIAVAIAAAWWLWQPRATVSSTGHTVALVGFSNLSGNAKDAWIAPAFAEMLDAELNVGTSVQSVPSELVRDASIDLSPPSAGGYSAATLERLRQRLHADYVISGSYLVSSPADNAPLRLDIALQDSHTGTMVAAISRQSDIGGLIALASEAGAALRQKLGASGADAQTLARVANLRPPSVDVARRVGFALDALQHYDPARARDELLEAVAESPEYAPTYAYLSQAWAALGYHDKALAAAEQAAARSADLPAEENLQAQAVVSGARGQWHEAAAAWGQLVALRPADIDYRLHAIDAQVAAGATAQARTSLAALQRTAAGDPRVELAAARVATALDDAQGAATSAALALQHARARDATGLAADAQLTLAGAEKHLNQNEAARAGLSEAITAYRAIHNPRGEAAARNDLAQVLGNIGHNQEAREEYQRAMALDESIGDLGGLAQVYRNLCGMLWLAGDRAGAQAAARRGLELARETGDDAVQAWTLQALATIESDENASEAVLAEYREVVTLNERGGRQLAWPLGNVADLQRLRGELGAARATCAQAQAQAAPLSDPQFAVFTGFICGLIELDSGEEAAARGQLEEVQRKATASGDRTYLDNALMSLAQLDLDAGNWAVACERLTRARDGFAANDERTGEADAAALLAQCEQERGDHAASVRTLARVRELRDTITSRQEVYPVDIALARLGSTQGAAVQQLLRLGNDAEQRHFIGWALEARLAAWQLAQAGGSAQAAALREPLQRQARAHGYGRILRLLEQPPHAPAATPG